MPTHRTRTRIYSLNEFHQNPQSVESQPTGGVNRLVVDQLLEKNQPLKLYLINELEKENEELNIEGKEHEIILEKMRKANEINQKR